jgi:UDP-N-acetylmuramyl pentapeptide phosphotransferase/UDP-N-acetylglucosamine-1-phosphate transferase
MTLDIASWSLTGQLAVLGAAAFIVSAGLILALWPIFDRYWVTSPNARSSHRRPTPQGGGLAFIAATTIVVAVANIIVPALANETHGLWIVLAATIDLALVGATDDMRPLEALPRLFLQAVAVAVVIATLPTDLRIVPVLPWWLERACILFSGVWFVNLVNFMDGIDCMTVVEVVIR